MTITRVACPECRAGLKSATGFTVGQTVSCPKCETSFAVEAPRGTPDDEFDAGQPRGKRQADDGAEWSYKNSWMRYTVLGLLLVTLGVLGYLLYEKKMKESKDTANADDGDDVRVLDPKAPPGAPQVQPQIPNAGGGGPPPIGGPKRPAPGGPPTGGGPMRPMPASPEQLAEFQKQLVGLWASGTDTIEYKDDGTFVVTSAASADKKLTGKWKVTAGERAPVPPPQESLMLTVEWTPEGKPALSDRVAISDKRLTIHPILELDGSGKKPGKDFVKK